jgi:hypothetical protein
MYKISFLAIKLLAISFVTILYFSLGFLAAKGMDIFFKQFDQTTESKKPTWQIFLEIAIRLCLIGILIYLSRIIVKNIPFPLNGIYGFNYFKLKELHSEFIFTIPLFVFHDNFTAKIKSMYNRLKK